MHMSLKFVAAVAGMALAGCGAGGDSSPEPTRYSYQVPALVDDGWPVDNLASVGVDATLLTNMVNVVHDREYDAFLTNILIVKNGNLVFEEYFSDANMNTLSHMQSATKSIVSAIFGVAAFDGFVGSLDDSLYGYFPDYQHLSDPAKEAIQVRHVLTMTPGFDWNENSAPTFDSQNDNIAAYQSNNYIEYVLGKDLVSDPGADWNYNSGCPMLLAGIIRNRSGVHLDEFAAQRFFEPLGITRLRWEYQQDGLPLATGGLWLKARDSAKIGQVFLDGGKWQGQAIVASDWVDASLTEQARIDSNRSYGYLWWTQQRGGQRLWYAAGYGGQLIIMVPAESVVIVVNAAYTRDAGETGQRQATIWRLLDDYVLPAI